VLVIVTLLTMFGVALALSYFLSNLTSRPSGTWQRRPPESGVANHGRISASANGEVGELARVLNDMSARIEQQMQRLSRKNSNWTRCLRGMAKG